MNKFSERFSRTHLLLQNCKAANDLQNKKVLIVGVGGVGGHAAENIARAGIGHLVLVDGDNVDITNCNRQIIASDSTVGAPKVNVLANRLSDINPQGKFVPMIKFLKTPEDITALLKEHFDFAIDAIDDVPVKTELICQLKNYGIPFVSAMGAGGKLDPEQVAVADICKTHGCPLARIMRSKLKERGIRNGVNTIFSPEIPIRSFENKTIGSISYMPAVFGCFCAAETIKYFINNHGK